VNSKLDEARRRVAQAEADYLTDTMLGAKLDEVSLQRVYSHWKDRGFAIVSADRGTAAVGGQRTAQENNHWRKVLKAAIRKAGYGFVPLVGYWHEKVEKPDGSKEKVRLKEYPFLIPAKSGEDLTKLAIKLGRLDRNNPQETVLVVAAGGEGRFYNTRQDGVYDDGPVGSVSFKLPTFSPSKVADIYSRLRNKVGKAHRGPGQMAPSPNPTTGAFVFEGWRFAPPPQSFMEAARRKHDGEEEFFRW